MGTDDPTPDEVAAFLDDLRALSARLAAFEDVPADELAAFEARKRALIERIEPGYYDRGEGV